MSNNREPASQKESEMDQCPSAGDTPLPREIQGKIGKELRQVYGRMLAEPLPDKFSKLLEELGKVDEKK